jgi:hypothetical protein
MTPEQVTELRKYYQITFGSEEGKQVLKDLELRCHYHATTHTKGDVNETAFLEGQRAVLLFIKGMLKELDKNLMKEIKKEK